MPTLKTRKRAASPAPDPPAKKARRGKAAAEPDDDDNAVQATTSVDVQSKSTKAKGKATKSQTVDDDQDDAAPANASKKGRGKGKAAKAADTAQTNGDSVKDTTKDKASDHAIKSEDDDLDSTTAPAPNISKRGKGKGKAKDVKTEDDDPDSAAITAPATKSSKTGKGKAKDVKTEHDTQAGAVDSKPVEDDVNESQKISDGQFANDKTLVVAIDEECTLYRYNVHVDDSNGIIYDAALNQTNAGNNNNKFYKIQLLTDGDDYRTWTRWGRVGERGQSAELGNGSFADALKHFDKKFKDKSGLKWDDRGAKPKAGKYVFIEKSYDEDPDEDEAPAKPKAEGSSGKASTPKSTLAPPVQSLMEMIFNQQYFDAAMRDMNYDAQKLPLGKLSKATISRGYQALKDLSALLSNPSLAASEYETSVHAATEQLSNLYYSYIPHAFGRNRPPIIQTNDQFKKEVELMDSLTDLKDADAIVKAEKIDVEPINPLDQRFNGLGMQEMTPVPTDSNEFTELSQYLSKTCGQTHSMNYEVKDIFRIERQGENERFQKSNFSKIASDRRLLWHGSRATNYGGILSQGLRIAPPEAPVSGYMFGKGIYLADMSSKSANYCCSYASGGEALLLLCEAELGKPMQVLTDASYTAGEDAIAKNMYSTWGQGQTAPKGWKDATAIHPSLQGVIVPDVSQSPGDTKVPGAYLQYNEFICYDVSQVRLRYLLRVRT